MKSLKKLFIAIMAVTMCLTLAACGGSGGGIIYNPTPTPDPPAPPVNPKATITGYLSYGETASSAAPARAIGDLVNNAPVQLRKTSDYNTVLSTVYTANGKFVFTDLSAGDYLITARMADGAVVLKSEFPVRVENNKYEYNLGSAPVELVKTGDLTITAKDSSGAAVAEALVTLDGARNGYTDASGSIVFNEVTRGAHEVKASKTGYVDAADFVSVSGAATASYVAMVNSGAGLLKPEVSGLSFGRQGASEASVTEGDTLEMSVNSTNPNGGTLSFTWKSQAGEFTAQNEHTITGPLTTSIVSWKAPLLNWAGGQLYSYQDVSVSVNDMKGFVINRAARVKVINKNAVQFKIVSYPESLLAQLNQQFSYQISLSVPASYKYEKLDAPSTLSVSAAGLVTFTPQAYGEYNVVIKVSESASGYFQTQKFTLTAAVSIPELSGASYSKTVLKPGSGLSTIVKNLKTTEHLVAIGYNKSPSYSSFDISAYNLSASPVLKSPPAAFSNLSAPGAERDRAPETLSAETSASLKMDFARRENERLAARLKSVSDAGAAAARAPGASVKAAAVGDLKDFYSLNSLAWPPREYDWTRVSAKLRAIGAHCYVYEDVSTPYPYLTITDAEAERFKNAFDSEVYPLITGAFGSEPNPGIDNDSRIYILFTHNVNKQSAAGYFDSTNQLTQAALDASSEYNKNPSGYKYYSNEKEIFYMAVPKSTLKGEAYQNNTLGVLAHEFQHMINWNQHSIKNPDILEESWLNEGLSQLAQDIAGYGYQYGTLSFVIEPYLRYPESYSLTKFQFGLGYYGNAYLFARYMADRGINPMNLVKSTKTGKANVGDEIVKAGLAGSFDEFFEDFAAALYLSNGAVTGDAKYNFKSINIRAVQKDGTKLSGLKLNSTVYLPTTFKSLSLSEYAISAVKCQAQSAADFKFNMSESSGGGIGAVILRINGQ
ncbi:MAG: Neutral metalloprotease precursor [bacterium ADurb.Bin243]|nr:MAG: Neutral metalloprotease precursor [bacterium ADurb.Bin243]